MSTFEVKFPGGVAVDTTIRGHVVHTDQPQPLGGDTAPSPFDLFFASIATCAGFYALRFCQQRDLATEGLGVTLTTERDPAKKQVVLSRIEVRLPELFPQKYRDALIRAIDQCTVKKHILEPPRFEIVVTADEPLAEATPAGERSS